MHCKKVLPLLLFLLIISFCKLAAQPALPFWQLSGNSNADGAILGTTNNFPLNLYTNNLPRLHISTSGNIGIGTTTPTDKLHINGRGRFTGGLSINNGSILLRNYTDDTAMSVVGDQYVGIYGKSNLIGIYGEGVGAASMGLLGKGVQFGIYGQANGTGIYGTAVGTGVQGKANGTGVSGEGGQYGILGTAQGTGVRGKGNAYGVSGEGSIGVDGTGTGPGSFGVRGIGTFMGVLGYSDVQGSHGVYGHGETTGIYGETTYPTTGIGVRGLGGATGVLSQGSAYGVYAIATGSGGAGVYATSANTNAIFALSNNSDGIQGWTLGNTNPNIVATGVRGTCSTYGAGISGYSAYGASVIGYSGGTYAGLFFGNTFCYGIYQGSDKKLKKNINDIKTALDLIKQLKPKEYEFRQDEEFKIMNLPRGKHYGLIAQDVESILPNLVKQTSFNDQYANPGEAPKTTEVDLKKEDVQLMLNTQKKEGKLTDFKAVNYTELIPLLIKGIQELSQSNEELKSQLSELKKLLNQQTQGQPISVGARGKGSLLQNMPNPVKTEATILYDLPKEYQRAQLIITDNGGRIVKQFTLTDAGKIAIDVSAWANGMYQYSLQIDDQIIQTRKMTVIK
jgi:hypothetical protein